MNIKALEKLSKMSEKSQRVGKKSKVTNTYNYSRPAMAGAYNTANGELTIADIYWVVIVQNQPTTAKMAVAPQFDDDMRINFKNIMQNITRLLDSNYKPPVLDTDYPTIELFKHKYNCKTLALLFDCFKNEQDIEVYTDRIGALRLTNNKIDALILPIRE